MELLEPYGGLQPVVSGIRASREDVYGGVLRISRVIDEEVPALIGVIETREPRALAAHVRNFNGERTGDLLLKVQIPALYVGGTQAEVGNEDGL